MDLLRGLGYALSLPERTLRSLSAAVGGASKLLTDTLLPSSLRGTTSYQALLGNTQRFLIEAVGEVKTGAADPLPDDVLARKVAGNVADAAGLLAFHFSPLWFFALVSDAASGSRDILSRMVEELKKDGALAPDAKAATAEELLDALGRAAKVSSRPFDVAPLRKEDLAAMRGELQKGYGEVWSKAASAVPSPEALWESFLEVRRKEALPMLTLAGAMALSGAKAAGKTAGSLFHEKVIRSYGASLEAVRKEGFGSFFAREAKPYVEAVAGAFSPGKRTFTERLLGGWPFNRRANPATDQNQRIKE